MYPSLLRRFAATAIDVAAVFWAVSFIIQRPLVLEPEQANLWAAIAFALLYETVLVTYACTLGQVAMRTRVRQFETLERISLRKSYLRFVMKYVASIAGAVGARGSVSSWPQGDTRALHDLQAGTVVVTADAVDG